MKKSFRQNPLCLFHKTIVNHETRVAFMGYRGKRRRLCVNVESQSACAQAHKTHMGEKIDSGRE